MDRCYYSTFENFKLINDQLKPTSITYHGLFERQTYKNEAFNFSDLRSLEIQNTRFPPAFFENPFPALQTLGISISDGKIDLACAPLKKMKSLQTLNIHVKKFNHLDNLSNLKECKLLTLHITIESVVTRAIYALPLKYFILKFSSLLISKI